MQKLKRTCHLQRKVVARAQTGRRWRLSMTRTAVFQCPILWYTWRGPTNPGGASSLHRLWFILQSDLAQTEDFLSELKY